MRNEKVFSVVFMNGRLTPPLHIRSGKEVDHVTVGRSWLTRGGYKWYKVNLLGI
jgi:hypothetical protein